MANAGLVVSRVRPRLSRVLTFASAAVCFGVLAWALLSSGDPDVRVIFGVFAGLSSPLVLLALWGIMDRVDYDAEGYTISGWIRRERIRWEQFAADPDARRRALPKGSYEWTGLDAPSVRAAQPDPEVLHALDCLALAGDLGSDEEPLWRELRLSVGDLFEIRSRWRHGDFAAAVAAWATSFASPRERDH